MAEDTQGWLVDGMIDLKTLRVEDSNKSVNFKNSKTVLGFKKFENHTYISLDNSIKHKLSLTQNRPAESYLISSNAQVKSYRNGISNKSYQFEGGTALKLIFNLKSGCTIESKPKYKTKEMQNSQVKLLYKDVKKATVNVLCR